MREPTWLAVVGDELQSAAEDRARLPAQIGRLLGPRRSMHLANRCEHMKSWRSRQLQRTVMAMNQFAAIGRSSSQDTRKATTRCAPGPHVARRRAWSTEGCSAQSTAYLTGRSECNKIV